MERPMQEKEKKNVKTQPDMSYSDTKKIPNHPLVTTVKGPAKEDKRIWKMSSWDGDDTKER